MTSGHQKFRIQRDSKMNIWTTMSSLQQKIDKTRTEIVYNKVNPSDKGKDPSSQKKVNLKLEINATNANVASLRSKLAMITVNSSKQREEDLKRNLRNENFSLENSDNAQSVFWILQKRMRSGDELQLLDRALSALKFFKEMKLKLSQQLYETLLSEIHHKVVLKHTIIAKPGEESKEFFVLLKGKIFIMKPKENQSLVKSIPARERTYTRRKTRVKSFVPKSVKSPNLGRKSEISSMKNLDAVDTLAESHILTSLSPEKNTSFTNKSFSKYTPPTINANFSIEKELQMNIVESPVIEETKRRRTTMKKMSMSIQEDSITRSQKDALADLLMIKTNNDSKLSGNEEEESEEKSMAIDYIKELEEIYPDLAVQNTFKVGESFGEAALTFKTKRKETLIAVEDSHLVILNENGFKEILGAYQSEKLQKKISFFRAFNMFNYVSGETMGRLMYLFEEVEFKIGQNIFKEGESCDSLYFVINGQVEISRNIQIFDQNEEGREDLREMNNKLNRIVNDQMERQNMKRTKLYLCVEKTFFGQEEIVLGLNSRATKAKCVSTQCHLYRIMRDKLEENFAAFGVLEALKRESEKQGVIISKREMISRNLAQEKTIDPMKKALEDYYKHVQGERERLTLVPASANTLKWKRIVSADEIARNEQKVKEIEGFVKENLTKLQLEFFKQNYTDAFASDIRLRVLKKKSEDKYKHRPDKHWRADKIIEHKMKIKKIEYVAGSPQPEGIKNNCSSTKNISSRPLTSINQRGSSPKFPSYYKTDKNFFSRTTIKASTSTVRPNSSAIIDPNVSIQISDVKKMSRVSSAPRYGRSPPRSAFQDLKFVDQLNPSCYVSYGYNNGFVEGINSLISKNDDHDKKRSAVIRKKEMEMRYKKIIVNKRGVKSIPADDKSEGNQPQCK